MAAGFTGVETMKARLARIAERLPREVAQALYQETEVVATAAKKRTPVDTGALRGSIYVDGPATAGGTISTAIVAGGPAAPYAVIVHENLYASHPVGEAKFIERPLMEAVPGLPARVSRRIDLNRAAGF